MRASLVLAIALFALPLPAQEEDRGAMPPPPIPPQGSGDATQSQRETQRAADDAETGAEGRERKQSEGTRRPQPLPPKVEGETVEPEVTIRRESDRTVEEYSVQGRVYMIKIDPDNAPPYYILDTDGDGEIDIHDDERFSPVQPVQWKLFEWD